MNKNFYKKFEDRFRGPRKIIKERLKVYLPFIEPITSIYPEAQAIDLGCGRGEWLEILDETGITGQGVDLDDGMLSLCRKLDLNVYKSKALNFIKKQENESLSVITAIHLVEHIPFDDLVTLVGESFRVLKPAGILIIETPNPENIVVGSSTFYTDPTHHRPIPMSLLRYVVENCGFTKCKNLRLHENRSARDLDPSHILSVLNGASPDYAVIAQKQADSQLMEKFTEAFSKEYGHKLADKATEYDTYIQTKISETISQVNQKISTQDNELIKIKNEINDQDIELSKIKNEINDQDIELSKIKNEINDQDIELSKIKNKIKDQNSELLKLNQKKKTLEAELISVYASKSWRITKPLRETMKYIRDIKSEKRFGRFFPLNQQTKSLTDQSYLKKNSSQFKQNGRLFLNKIIKSLLSRPKIRSKIIQALNHVPIIKLKIKNLMKKYGINTMIYISQDKHFLKIDSVCEKNKIEKMTTQKNKHKGVNSEMKSPLENWFN